MTDRVAEIRERASAATPGPWRWSGNVDNSDPRLVGRSAVLGWTSVIDHVPVPRRVTDPQLNVDHLADHIDDRETRREIVHEYLFDSWGQRRTDRHLAFGKDGIIVDARTMVKFEVAPEATDRSDPRVYRADIVGVRHPDAEFIAHSRSDIEFLLEEVARLTEIIEEHRR
ncbi:MAG: hypothetical protein WC054_01395 [Candidatus Nanopelagicales bacterium]